MSSGGLWAALINGTKCVVPISLFQTLDEIKEYLHTDYQLPREMRLFRDDGEREITCFEEIVAVPGSNVEPLESDYFTTAFRTTGKRRFVIVKPSLRYILADFDATNRQLDVDKALSGALMDPHNSVGKFVEFLKRDIIGKYNSNVHYSPYTAVVASSMTGKTRHCLEALKQMWGVYICLRKEDQNGSPGRSFIVDRILSAESLTTQQSRDMFFKLNIACIEKAAEAQRTGMSKKEWLDLQMDPEAGPKDNIDSIRIGRRFWQDVIRRMDQIKGNFFDDTKFLKGEECEELMEKYKILDNFVLIMDEARSLLNQNDIYATLFHQVRTAAKMMMENWNVKKKRLGFCCVFVDTLSKMSNFLPPKNPGPSDRFISSRPGRELMAPFWTIETWNAAYTSRHQEITKHWFDEYLAFINGVNGAKMPPLGVLQGAYLLRGRPAWKRYLTDSHNTYRELLVMAETKMLRGHRISAVDFSKGVPQEVAAALLTCRFCLEISPSSKLSTSLIEGYMAQCLYISDDRKLLFLTYGLDGCIVEASCQIMHYERNTIAIFINAIHEFLADGSVTPGPKGEFFTRLLVGLAMDSAIKKTLEQGELGDLSLGQEFPFLPAGEQSEKIEFVPKNIVQYVKPVTVKMFLNSLFPESQVEVCLSGQLEDARDLDLFMNGVVFFNRCVELSESPNERVLEKLFYSCQFGQCDTNEAAIDQIVPVLLAGNIWSFIGIQSRLYSDSDPKYKYASSTFHSKMYGVDLHTVPAMLLYFSLGYKNPRLVNLKYERHMYANQSSVPQAENEEAKTDERLKKMKHLCLGAFGLSHKLFPFLSGEDASSMRRTMMVLRPTILAKGKSHVITYMETTCAY